jgi:hypothetical protein
MRTFSLVTRRYKVRSYSGQDVCAWKQDLQRWSKGGKGVWRKLFWVLGGIPQPDSEHAFEYYVIPSKVIADNVAGAHKLWLKTPGKNNRAHQDSSVRTVYLPPGMSFSGWHISEYRDRWDLNGAKLGS